MQDTTTLLLRLIQVVHFAKMLRRLRQIRLVLPEFPVHADFECCFCLREFAIYPEPCDGHADFCTDVMAHIREFYPERWELVRPDDMLARRIHKREVRRHLLRWDDFELPIEGSLPDLATL
jgi:hypothetical protein